jgi:hypothetical protein
MSGTNDWSESAVAAAAPKFWRDDALPFIEARSIEDGREVCYAKHSHETFSIGAVTGGHSVYVNRHASEWIGAGAVVMMNPDDVHACNPVADERWSYRMLHVEVDWLTGLQHDLGFSHNHAFRAFSQTMTTDPALFDGLNRLYAILVDDDSELMRKESAAVTFFSEVQQKLNPAPLPDDDASGQLARAAESGGRLQRGRAFRLASDPRFQTALWHDAACVSDQPAHPVQPRAIAARLSDSGRGARCGLCRSGASAADLQAAGCCHAGAVSQLNGGGVTRVMRSADTAR